MRKKVIIVVFATLAIFAGGFYLVSKGDNSAQDLSLPKVEAADVQVSPDNYDIGRVLMKNGIVTREYEIKNNSENTLRLKKIVTSCMCTKAQVVAGDKRTRLYTMEGGVKNPIINFDIPAKSTAKVIVKFDPAAHGIQGVGPINRSAYLTFLDPVGQKEVKFSGEVVLK
ncbi:MAG: DUF1573 domain-containing protein [Patescibacteria group bacterium]